MKIQAVIESPGVHITKIDRAGFWNYTAAFERQDNDVKSALLDLTGTLVVNIWNQLGVALKERKKEVTVCGLTLTLCNVPELTQDFELGSYPLMENPKT